jgi:hypothetical protein
MVTFETKCYENDWEFILRGRLLEKMIGRCNYDFSRRKVFINNVSDLNAIVRCAERKVRERVIDEFIVVDDYAERALQFFELTKESFGVGYYYSIAELVSIYLCTTPYLLHFSSDTILEPNSSKWIQEAIALFSERTEFAVANPVWDHQHDMATSESTEELPEWYIGYGFSDQGYLLRTEYFKQPVYNEHNEQSERYLRISGELFEKRVDAYMRNHRLLRITNKGVSYLHHNFPRNPIKRMLRKMEIRNLE